MLSSVEILILSAIQGISEFLPVSSAAHLVLISNTTALLIIKIYLIDICLHLRIFNCNNFILEMNFLILLKIKIF